jgi:uridine kinase
MKRDQCSRNMRVPAARRARIFGLGALPTRPFIIGIAGPSGSGKTALARRLAPRLPRGCAVISVDSYYFPRDHLPLEEPARLNYDHPSAIDWDLLLEHLTRLRSGQPIEQAHL